MQPQLYINLLFDYISSTNNGYAAAEFIETHEPMHEHILNNKI